MNARKHVTAALRAVSVSLILVCTLSSLLQAQTPGFIYQPSSSALGRSVLDPNGDGFTSPTSGGFSGTDYGTGSELKMIPLPIIQEEPHSDLTTGSAGGHTDIVSGNPATRQSAFILYKTVNNIPYVIIRMRIGKASTSPKGYSFLLNTDGNFLTGSGGVNPGYDREIVLETGNPGQVSVYQHTVSNGGATTSTVALTTASQFPASQYSQRSVALTTTNDDPDYFYDFFVPFSILGIASNPVGITAVTVTSAGSGITGTISDFNGVNDKLYPSRNAIMSALITAFPPLPITSLTEDFNPNSWASKTLAPVVNGGITTSATSVSGSSSEANTTKIYLYKNDVLLDSTITVTNNAWTKNISNPSAGDVFKAKARAPGKTISDFSNLVTVAGAVIASPCTLAAPVINARTSGGRDLSGTAPAGSQITFFFIDNNQTPPYIPAVLSSQGSCTGGTFPITIGAGGTFTFGCFGSSQSDFDAKSYIARVTMASPAPGCTSDYSLVSLGTNNTTTTAPAVITTPIYASTASTAVVVKNNHGTSANILFYVNGQLQSTNNSIATGANTTFSYSGFNAGDVVSARAIGTATNSVLSGLSNTVTVLATVQQQTTAPVITGTYGAGSNITITGTSTEPAGTTITIYKGATLIGTVTATSYGTWQLTNQTLAANDVLTAYAKATDKSLSGVSNSVTVQPSAPNPPTVTGTYNVGAASVTGGTAVSGIDSVRVYLDGELIGTAVPSSGTWTLSGLASHVLYRGGKITARNVVNGIESINSNPEVIVLGPVSFEVLLKQPGTTTWSNSITAVSGDVIPIRIKAKDNVNGGGSDFTAFTKNAYLYGTAKLLNGEGNTDNFVSGAHGHSSEKTITIGGGTVTGKKIRAVDLSDPTLFGEATIDVTEALWAGTDGTDAINKAHNQSSNWTHGRVPATGAKVKFAPAGQLFQDMVLESAYTWESVDFGNTSSNHGKNIVLNGFNLTLDTIFNRGNSVVKTLGAGKLKIPVSKGQSVLYPVNNGADNFVTITNNTAEHDDFAVRVFPNVYMGGTSGTLATSPRVNVTWDIDKTKANGGSGVNFTFNWLDNQVANGPISTYYVNHYRTTPTAGWEIANGTLSSVTVGTGGEKIMSLTGYPGTFSPFTIGGSVNALPVTLVSFEGTCQPTGAVLHWTSESEIFNDYYTVERSENLTDWEVIKTVPGAGNSNQVLHYSATDDRPLPGISYYRLKQTDYDGQYEYKGTVAVSCISQSGFTVFPNPGTGFFNLSGVPKGSKITLLDMMGKPLWQKENGTDEALQADLRFLDAGTYIMQVRTGAAVMHHKIVVSK
jgi:hypothetical protein